MWPDIAWLTIDMVNDFEKGYRGRREVRTEVHESYEVTSKKQALDY